MSDEHKPEQEGGEQLSPGRAGPGANRRDHISPDPDAHAPAEQGPLPLEEPDEAAGQSQHRSGSDEADRRAERPAGHGDEYCPNCMAPLHERGALVCLRCGFDLKTLKVAKTRIAKPVEVDEDEDDEAEAQPICRSGLGNERLPLIVAGVSGLLLLIGHLAGFAALFPPAVVREAGDEPIVFVQRILEIGRELVRIGVWTACAVAGLLMLAATVERKAGDLTLAAARLLSIVVTVRLVTFLHMPGPYWVEWTLEAILQAVLFIGLALAFFRLTPRNAALLGGFTFIVLISAWIIAYAIVWVH